MWQWHLPEKIPHAMMGDVSIGSVPASLHWLSCNNISNICDDWFTNTILMEFELWANEMMHTHGCPAGASVENEPLPRRTRSSNESAARVSTANQQAALPKALPVPITKEATPLAPDVPVIAPLRKTRSSTANEIAASLAQQTGANAAAPASAAAEGMPNLHVACTYVNCVVCGYNCVVLSYGCVVHWLQLCRHWL
jgi:hypothetical protein